MTAGWNVDRADLLKVAQVTPCTSPERIFNVSATSDVKVTREKRHCGSSEPRSAARCRRAHLVRRAHQDHQPRAREGQTTRHCRRSGDPGDLGCLDAEWSPIGSNTRQRDRRGRRIGRHHHGLPEVPGDVLGHLTDRSGSRLRPSVRRAQRAQRSPTSVPISAARRRC